LNEKRPGKSSTGPFKQVFEMEGIGELFGFDFCAMIEPVLIHKIWVGDYFLLHGHPRQGFLLNAQARKGAQKDSSSAQII
jgi:hypothetical protein